MKPSKVNNNDTLTKPVLNLAGKPPNMYPRTSVSSSYGGFGSERQPEIVLIKKFKLCLKHGWRATNTLHIKKPRTEINAGFC